MVWSQTECFQNISAAEQERKHDALSMHLTALSALNRAFRSNPSQGKGGVVHDGDVVVWAMFWAGILARKRRDSLRMGSDKTAVVHNPLALLGALAGAPIAYHSTQIAIAAGGHGEQTFPFPSLTMEIRLGIALQKMR